MEKRKAYGLLDSMKIKKLYKSAFPICERKPFSVIRAMQKKGKSDIWIYEENGSFIGFATTINGDDAVLVDYLAVKPAFRGKGFGRRILARLKDYYGEDKLFLEIESVAIKTENYEERRRRKAFYLSCGMEEMGLTVNIFQTDMELLSYGCRMTFEEYRDFYRKNYNEFAAKHIIPAQGKLPSGSHKRKKL